MKGWHRCAAGLLLAAAAAAPTAADIVFPARLDVVETAPGRYDVTFDLPLVQGRLLRAEPSLPPSCRDVTPHERVATSTGVTTTWSAHCAPPSLAGEAIMVEGLLGTQIDLAFTLTTLDGREFNRILRPSRPGFLVPEPPSPADLAVGGTSSGLRWALRHTILWLLVLVAVLSGVRGRELLTAGAGFAAGVFGALWLARAGWLDVSAPVRDGFILLTALVPAVRVAGAGPRWVGWIRPAWPPAVLIGALCAGAASHVVPVEGLSRSEELIVLAFVAVGAAAGLALAAAVAIELRTLIDSIPARRWRDRIARIVATGAGALAAGMLIAAGVALTVLVRGFPVEPLALVLAASATGALLARSGDIGARAAPGFALSAGVGLALGLSRITPPFEELLVAALLLTIGMALIAPRLLASAWACNLCAATALVCTWSATHALVENVSRSTGASVATVLVATGAVWAGVTAARGIPAAPAPLGARALGAAVAAWAVLGRLAEYRLWWHDKIATDASFGLLRIPLLALALAALGLVLWPRRRRVLDRLGVTRPRPAGHLVALVAAFILVPYGTVTVPRPFFEPHAPRGEDARRVVEAVLSGTYHAFNLSDESEVYDRLDANVTSDLVDDVYLDSRRRLTAGTRQGAEVTVRAVEVLEIGAPENVSPGANAFSYDCRWVVTSRVRHLQHIHHRRNVYTGVLTLTMEAGRWKIARVDLTSEDRAVVPWKSA